MENASPSGFHRSSDGTFVPFVSADPAPLHTYAAEHARSGSYLWLVLAVKAWRKQLAQMHAMQGGELLAAYRELEATRARIFSYVVDLVEQQS